MNQNIADSFEANYKKMHSYKDQVNQLKRQLADMRCNAENERLAKVEAERQLAKAVARKQKWAKWIANHTPEYGGDHACSRCYPHSDIIKSGYVCAYHEALDYLESHAIVAGNKKSTGFSQIRPPHLMRDN